jgi:two-component system sensor histidine kinase/response regulator
MNVLVDRVRWEHTDSMLGNESPFSPPPLCLRILLAENLAVTPCLLKNINLPQTLMVRVLDKLGHIVVQAANGREALSRVMDERFDLLLMDVQMPDIDALAVSLAIREQEKVLGGHLPIIAMSNHAIKIDRKRCVAAGMDCYTSKPRNSIELHAILTAFSDPESLHATRRPMDWNRTAALERAGGDENALQNLVAAFVSGKRILLAEMNHAVHTRQADLLERSALKLGEELSYLGATGLYRIARQLALLGTKRDFIKAGKLAVALQSQLSEMDAVMAMAVP